MILKTQRNINLQICLTQKSQLSRMTQTKTILLYQKMGQNQVCIVLAAHFSFQSWSYYIILLLLVAEEDSEEEAMSWDELEEAAKRGYSLTVVVFYVNY